MGRLPSMCISPVATCHQLFSMYSYSICCCSVAQHGRQISTQLSHGPIKNGSIVKQQDALQASRLQRLFQVQQITHQSYFHFHFHFHFVWT